MQKTIIIALLVASAICVQVNVGPVAVPTAGYAVTMGVIQKCDRSCLTCSGPLVTDCLTCIAGLAKTSTGTCGCATATDYISVVTGSTTTMLCEANTVASGAGTATLALCEGITTAELWYDSVSKGCKFCDNICKKCGGAAAGVLCVQDATGCWAGLSGTQVASANSCAYIITATRVTGVATVHDQTGATLSVLNGYFYTAGTTFTQDPCAAGCLTCDAAGGATGALGNCLTCAAGFSLNTATLKRCECATTAGFFTTAATATAFDLCTSCGTGVLTCTSATEAVTCDTSYTLTTSSVTATNKTCVLTSVSSTSTDSSASSTDGESSATTTSATDAASTSGVLITAASMLLAVILA